MADRRPSSGSYVIVALVGIAAMIPVGSGFSRTSVALVAQTRDTATDVDSLHWVINANADQPQNPGEPQIRMRLNGREVDVLQGARGGFIVTQPQAPNIAGSDPLPLPVVKNAPYSGEGVTAVTQTLGDGTRIEQGTTAKFYRDSAGRVRREQTVIGLAPLNPAADAQVIVTVVPNPDDPWAYQLSANARTARRVMRAAGPSALSLSTALTGVAIPAPTRQSNSPVEESLGVRQFEGVRATGTKTTTTIPVGQIGNDRALEITDERWESPELKVVVYSRHSDPRSGVVEYKLTGISRTEPADYLFQIPSDYTVIDALGGARTGGPGTGAGAGARGGPATVPVPPGARGGRQ